MTQPTHGLIDGDIIVYRVGFSSEDDSEEIVAARVDSFIDNILINADITSAEGYITHGASNFRNAVAKTLPYKGNRSGKKPVHYGFIRRYLANVVKFNVVNDFEADDALAIRATEHRDSVVICSIDKDLRQVPGWHYNFVTKTLDYVDDDEGLYNFYTQILTGDRTDNIPGIPGIGPIKANRILEVVEKTDDMLLYEHRLYYAVVHSYMKLMSLSLKEALTAVEERGKLLWLFRKQNGIWTPPNY
jgi:5'-3' exonuclease